MTMSTRPPLLSHALGTYPTNPWTTKAMTHTNQKSQVGHFSRVGHSGNSSSYSVYSAALDS